MRTVVATLFALLAALALAQQDRALVFEDVDVFDGRELRRNLTVVVEDGLVTDVGEDVQVPGGAEVIAGEGRTLLPGLMDAHVHVFFPEALEQNLVFGVTTVLDMFTEPTFAAAMREGQPAADRADLFSAGVLATAAGGHGTQFGLTIPTLDGAEDAEAWVEERIAEGSDYIKVILESGEELGMNLPTLDDATLHAVVDEAHERDMLVVTHVQTIEDARRAIEAGTDGLGHMFVDAVPDEEFVAMAVDAGIFVIPTLVVFQTIGGEPVDESLLEDERLSPFLTFTDRQNLTSPFPGYEDLSFGYALEGVGKLHEAGVPILAGTDAMNPGVAYGASLHRELELLTEAGLSPSEALAAATAVPAEIFGLGERGVIAPGAAADLLLVDGDPTEDITATRRIEGVWKRGVRADREAYAEQIRAQEQASSEQSEALASGEPVLVSDFESGEAQVAFGQPWEATTDVQAGGDSQASISVVPGGPEGSEHALQVEGEVGTAFMLPWAGAMFMPGSAPFLPADLSAVPVLQFAVAGEPASYRIQLFCQNAQQIPFEWPFEVTEEWQSHTVDLAEVGGCDVSGVMAIIFSSGEPGEFSFTLDDVTLLPREGGGQDGPQEGEAAAGGQVQAPAAPGSQAETTAETTPGTVEPEARALFERAREAHGGNALDGLDTYTEEGVLLSYGPGGEVVQENEFRTLVDYGGRRLRTEVLQDGELFTFQQVTPEGAFAWSSVAGEIPLTPEQASELYLTLDTGIHGLARGLDEAQSATVLGEVTVAGVTGQGLQVTRDGNTVTMLLDDDGRLIGESYNLTQLGEIQTLYTDWETVDGVLVPSAYEGYGFGMKLLGARLDDIELNPELTAADFSISGADAPEVSEEALGWLEENVVPLDGVEAGSGFEDLEAFGEMVGDARVVALGEQTHGTAEFFTMKHRLLEYLASEKGFTLFAIEANMPEAFLVDEYVMTGEGNAQALLQGLYFWTWYTQEVLDMIEWMRSYNETADEPLHFLGFDMQFPYVAAQELREFLAEADPDYLAEIEPVLAGVEELYTSAAPDAQGVGDLDEQTARIVTELEANRDSYAAELNGQSVEHAIQNARIVEQSVGVLEGGAAYRDLAMARNVEWLLEQYPGEKMVIWAHNGHVAEAENWMGGHLDEALGDDYFSVAFSFYEGEYRAVAEGGVGVNTADPAPEGSIDSVFNRVGPENFYLDLRGAESTPAASWLAQERLFRSIGALAGPASNTFAPTMLADAFDAVIFIRESSASVQLDPVR